MKKSLLLSALTMAGMSAMATINVEGEWVKGFDDGAPMCNVNNICNSADKDGYFVVNSFSAGASSLKWGDEEIALRGALNTTYQKGFTLAKIHADGSLEWSVSSATANVANNYLYVTPAKDGGVVLAVNATFGKAGAGSPLLISLTDVAMENHVINVEYKADCVKGQSPYCGVVMLFNRDGVMTQSRLLYSYATASDELYDANPLAIRSLTTDEEGNIYVGGNHKLSMTVEGNESLNQGASVNSAPNAAGTGVNAGSTGFIVKYDPTLAPTAIFTNSSESAYSLDETVNGLAAGNGKVYFAALVDGLAGGDYKLCGEDVAINNSLNDNVVYGYVDAGTMELGKASALASEKGNSTTHVTQLNGLQLINGNTLALNMSLNGAFNQDGKEIASSAAAGLEVSSVTADAESLEALMGYCGGEKIGGGMLTIIDEENNTTYNTGYVMNSGVVLYSYDSTSGEKKDKANLTSAISSTTSALYDEANHRLLTGAYAKDLGTIAGGLTAPTYSAFHGYLLSVKLPGVHGAAGAEAIESAPVAEGEAEYYNLQGMRVVNPQSGSLVIRRQGGEVTKMVVR